MSNFDSYCFVLNITTINGLSACDNPFVEAIPFFITQLAAILIVSRFLYHLFKPLHQPRIVSDLLGGILLGKSACMRSVHLDFFPLRKLVMVETFAYMALILHMFLVGLELDLHAIGRISKKAILITVTALIVPFVLGLGIYYLLHSFLEMDNDQDYSAKCSFLWVSILTATCFPTVSQVLSDLKLLNSEIGRISMPIALISDVGSWIVVVIFIPFSYNPTNAPYVIITTTAYILASFYSIRPILERIVSCTSEGNNNYSDFYLCFVLVGVSLNAFLTDVTGTHPIVGAFVFGLIMPTELALVLLDRFYFIVSGLMLPVFFTLTGIRVDVFKITTWSLLVVIVISLGALKIISFLPISRFSNINNKDKFALGILMSTKGTLALVIVNIGWEKELLLGGDYAVTVIAMLLMNSMVAPTLTAIYKRTNFFKKYKSRSIQEARSETELRILVCIQSFCDVPGMLKLLGASHGSRHNPMTVFTLHLVEFPGSTSPMLIVHDSNSPRFESGSPTGHHDFDNSETDQIVTAFAAFEKQTRNVRVHSLTSVSPYASKHGDICSLAEDKLVAFLILPFRKRATRQGSLKERLISSFRSLNHNVLDKAPCSVGIFVDRGLDQEAKTSDFDVGIINNIAMVFLGGADDCEALACARRMARTRGVSLTVIRLLESDSIDSKKGNEIDDDYINEFRIQTVDEEYIVYEEKVLQDGDELIAALKEVENKFDLLVVGRRDGLESSITTDIIHRVDFPELGVIGDLLAVSNSATSSVLVVQQFVVSIDSQVIQDFIGVSSMDRSAMHFGSRRLATTRSNKLRWHSKKKKAAKLLDIGEDEEEDHVK